MFRLALALGFPHPDYLLEVLSARQLAEWQQYYSLEPFGFPAESWRSGIVASVIANANRKKGRKAFQPSDFMPREPETKKERRGGKLKSALSHLVKRNV